MWKWIVGSLIGIILITWFVTFWSTHYINSNGDIIHSPMKSDIVPRGATAKCRDGYYSFSQSRRGTCSSDGGVDTWY